MNIANILKSISILVLLSACEVPTMDATIAPTGTPTPAVETKNESCPKVFPDFMDGHTAITPYSDWLCTSNCSQVPFEEIRFTFQSNHSQSFAMFIHTDSQGAIAQYNDFEGGDMVSQTPFVGAGYLNAPGQLFTDTNAELLTSTLDCDQMTINGAIFTNQVVPYLDENFGS